MAKNFIINLDRISDEGRTAESPERRPQFILDGKVITNVKSAGADPETDAPTCLCIALKADILMEYARNIDPTFPEGSTVNVILEPSLKDIYEPWDPEDEYMAIMFYLPAQ